MGMTESFVDLRHYFDRHPALRLSPNDHRRGVGAGWAPCVTAALDQLHALALDVARHGQQIVVGKVLQAFGRLVLQVSVDGLPPAADRQNVNVQVRRIARDAVLATATLCEECGALGAQVRKFGGWLKTRCDACSQKFWNEAERFIAAQSNLKLEFAIVVPRAWMPTVLQALEHFAAVAREAEPMGLTVTIIQIKERRGKLMCSWQIDYVGQPADAGAAVLSLPEIENRLQFVVRMAEAEVASI